MNNEGDILIQKILEIVKINHIIPEIEDYFNQILEIQRLIEEYYECNGQRKN